MDPLEVTQWLSYVSVGACLIIAILGIKRFNSLRYSPLVTIAVGIALIGIDLLIDAFTISQTQETPLSQVMLYARVDSVVGTIAIGIVWFGFLQSHKNSRLFVGRMVLFFFLIGVTATSYAYSPSITLEWASGAGWQYVYTSPEMIILDQFLFIPLFELMVRAIWRLKRPFRTPRSRRVLIAFAVGLLTPFVTNLISYAGGSVYLYAGIAVGFCVMGMSFALDPFVLSISRARVYDLVVSIRSLAIARFNFEKSEAIRNENLFSGAFSGISTLMGEAISSKADLNYLQTGDKAVIIAKSHLTQVYLITSGADEVCLHAITAVGRAVDQYYANKDLSVVTLIDPVIFEKIVLKFITFA